MTSAPVIKKFTSARLRYMYLASYPGYGFYNVPQTTRKQRTEPDSQLWHVSCVDYFEGIRTGDIIWALANET